MSEITVSGLYTYPIKSCGAAQSQTIQFSELGFEHDREFMLVGNRNQFISQRTFPELAVVKTEIRREPTGIYLYAHAPDMGELAINLASLDYCENPEINIDLFKKQGLAREHCEEASMYFSEYLKKDVKLMRLTGARTIKSECHVSGASISTSFADGFPLLMTSVESLEKLNKEMRTPVEMNRFRPNIVVEGAPAYDEDYWRELRIGDLQAYVVRACARCPMPNVEQTTGELDRERPVTEVLRKHRAGIDPINDSKGEFFGQNLTHVFEDGLTLSVGDEVTNIKRSLERNFTLLNRS